LINQEPVLALMTKAFVLLFATVLAFSACTGYRTASNLPPELLAPVSATIRTDTATITRGTVAEVRQYTGIVRASSESIGFGSVAARFGVFYVQPGDMVSQGQLLARLDFEQIQIRIARQEEHITATRRQQTLANNIRAIELDIQYLENARLMQQAIKNYDKEAIAAAESGRLDIYRARMESEFLLEQQALALRHEESYLDSLKEQYERSKLHAPFDGMVTYIADLLPGSWVASFTAIMHIVADDAPIFVEYIGESYPNLHGVARIHAHIGGQIYNAARLNLTREQILRYGGSPLRFTLETAEPPPVGSFVSMYVYTHFEEDVLRIPRNALHHDPDMGFYVYRVDGLYLTQEYLTIGPRTETYVAVLSGLVEGDVVSVRS